MAARAARGVAFLERVTPRDTEDRASQLLGLRWGGAPASARAPLAAALVAEQHADGGWSQLPTCASDAYATGQTLVALHVAGEIPLSSEAYRRGIEFLLRSQEADGSWHVVTRRKDKGLPYFETGFPHGEDQFISFSGSAWAVAALALVDDPHDGRHRCAPAKRRTRERPISSIWSCSVRSIRCARPSARQIPTPRT